MTQALDRAVPGAAVPGAAARPLADQVVRLTRVLTAMKARQSHTSDGMEKAAFALLFPLISEGPLRSGTLAERVHADPSTVSRHVAALLRRDLVRREADPVDGRASLLAVSPAGRTVAAEICERRDAVLAEVLLTWSEADVAALTALLARFIDDLDAALPSLSPRPPHAEGTPS